MIDGTDTAENGPKHEIRIFVSAEIKRALKLMAESVCMTPGQYVRTLAYDHVNRAHARLEKN